MIKYALMTLSIMITSTTLASIPKKEDPLMKTFWECDYAASQSIMNPGDAEICSLNYEKVKFEKFNGDFSKLLEWWKANKTAQHAALSKKL